jgi:hypothetical protein
MPESSSTIRPSDAINASVAVGHNPLSDSNTQLKIPAGVPAETTQLLKAAFERPIIRDEELRKLHELHDGGMRLIKNPKYFPKPEGLTDNQWEKFLRLLVLVNLVKPALRRFVASVYGGAVIRTVEGNGAESERLRDLVSPLGYYPQDTRNWFENAGLFGTGVAAWVYDEDGNLETWLPNPVHTHIIANRGNLRDVLGVFEYSPDGTEMRFMTKEGMGIARSNDSGTWTQTDWGFLPATVGYGQSCIHRGDIDGLSLVREAADYTVRASDATLNLSILQKIATRSTMVIEGSLESDLADAGTPTGFIKIETGGKVYHVAPEAKFKETIDVLNFYIGATCTILSVPRDTFDGTGTSTGDSAEGAKLRAMPHASATKFLIEEWRLNEIDRIRRGAALQRWLENKGVPVKLKELARSLKINVQMEPASIPDSFSQEVAAWVQLLLNGGKRPEDFARHFNPLLPDEVIAKMADDIREKIKSAMDQSAGRGVESMGQRESQAAAAVEKSVAA